MTTPTDHITLTTADLPTDLQIAPLTLLDRCDACGAAAKVATIITRGKAPLLWCGHHWRVNAARLNEIAYTIRDERDAKW